MKRIALLILAIILFGTSSIALASDISTANYYGTVRISNNSTAATEVSVPITGANTTSFIDGGFLNSAANNTAMLFSGADVPFMPGYSPNSNPWIVFAPSLGANDYQNDILYAGATGGKIRYFPAAIGANVTDNATIEPSSNFTFSIQGYIDTAIGTNKLILQKSPALQLYVSPTVSGNITAEIPGGNTTSQLLTDSTNKVNNDAVDFGALGENFVGMPLSYLSSIDLKLTKVGVPTGTGNVTVRRNSDNMSIGKLGEIDVSTIAGVATFYTFSGTPVLLTESTIKVTFEYNGGNAGNYINVSDDSANPIAAGALAGHNAAGWADTAGFDLTWQNMVLGIISVSATGVTSGEHTVMVSENNTLFWISIDGVNSANTTTTATIPNNSSNYTFFQNNVMPYVQAANITVGGNLKGSWAWQYGANFTDLTGNNNTMIPSFRTISSDADVSAALLNFIPVKEADAPPYTINATSHDFTTTNLTVTSNFTTTVSTGFDFLAVLQDVSTAGNTPYQLPLLLGALFTILVISFSVTWLLRSNQATSLIAQTLIILIMMAIAVALDVFDVWMLVYFIPIALGCAMASGTVFQGTGNTGENLFGFLVQNFLGWSIINQTLAGKLIESTDVSIVQNFLAFTPFNVFNIFTIPVPNVNFLINGLPALLNWDEYSFLSGNAQFVVYLMYSITAVVSFMLFVIAMGSVYQLFSRGR